MSSRTIALIGIALFALVFLLALYLRADWIEHDVRARATDALEQQGYAWARVSSDGRDVTLSGEAPAQTSIDRAVKLLSEIWGVRVVHAAARVSPDAAGGTLPSEAVAARISAWSSDLVAPDVCQAIFRELLTTYTIEFESDSAVIGSHSLPLLDALASTAGRCPDARIEIVGHADMSGEQQMNIDLSIMRAEAVMAVLIDKGIAAERLSAVGYGSALPVASNAAAEGRARNRRIEFNVKE